MASKPVQRPLSPHLGIYKWGPHMLVSIVHRVLGTGMATVGTILVAAWLAATASGEVSYRAFADWFTLADGSLNPLGYLLGIGLSWSLFQHMGSGIRHLVLDTGAGYELKVNRTGARLTFVWSAIATIVFWAYLLVGK